MTGIVRTVLGDVSPESIGNILMHEHLLFDITPPGTDLSAREEITPANRWQFNYRSNENPENTCQRDPAVAATELSELRADGGGLLVDQSTIGLARDPKGQAQASEQSGVPVVAATGTYTAAYLPPDLLDAGVDRLGATVCLRSPDRNRRHWHSGRFDRRNRLLLANASNRKTCVASGRHGAG